MKRWLAETHGPGFELLRHFVRRFFESDLTTTPGQSRATLIWAFALIVPWFFIFAHALFVEYRGLSRLSTPSYYRDAVRADELWLVTLMMSAVGLLTAVKWQSLFPGKREYYALGTLPLRPRQIFLAKLGALLTVTTAMIVVLVALPSVLFPLVSGGRWSIQPSLAARIGAHALASVAGCYFFFFGLVALQGVLLNVAGPRAFARIGATLQGLATAAMLVLLILSFSIGRPVIHALDRSPTLQWLPPLWFLGLYQARLGDPDPLMNLLARRAEVGLMLAIAIAMATYLLSYPRRRNVAMEGGGAGSDERRWVGAIFDAIVPGPRRQAVVSFLWKTLWKSGHHRTVLLAYFGVAISAVATGFVGMDGMFSSEERRIAFFVSGHAILLLFVLIGFRHLFSIPAELRANWTFQLAEREGRHDWLDAIDIFVLFSGAAAVLALPFPLEAKLVGWRAVAEMVLLVILGLVAYEWAFADWRKLPFTCSRLPGKTPLWITFLKALALVTATPIVSHLLVNTLFSGAALTVVVVLAAVAWKRMHAARREAWTQMPLTWDEAPDPAIHGLNLGK
jgi:hypothetical protein